jgi:pimeloyl-ACP methyl ester carboxylesterase
MRTLEIITAVLLFFSVIRNLFSKRPRWLEYLPTLTAISAVLQIILEGYRWQLVPIYFLTLILFIISFGAVRKFISQFFKRKWQKAVIWLFAIVLLVAAYALPILLPIPRLPESSGQYQVGTFSVMLTDPSRHEIYSEDASDLRSIMIQVWYPADPAPDDQMAPWMEHADLIGPAISKYLGLPSFFLDHLVYVKTGAYLNAPISQAETSYPVLLFSHGWNGFRAQNTFQAIQFASNGYIVVAIDHTYGAVLTVFPDGKLAYNNPEALPSNMPDPEYQPIANKLINQWSGDLGFVLNTLEEWNKNDPDHDLVGSLDLDHVGVFGHSTGGGATVEFCGRDSRCKAGIGMDAYLKPVSETVLDLGLEQPFLFMFSETWSSEPNWQLFNQLYLNSDDARVMTIMGTAHYDFSDLPILSPIAYQLGLKGPLNGKRVVEITSVYPLAFFDSVFYGISTPLLDGQSPDYPEVMFP